MLINNYHELTVEELTEYISEWMIKYENDNRKISHHISDRLALSIKHKIDNKYIGNSEVTSVLISSSDKRNELNLMNCDYIDWTNHKYQYNGPMYNKCYVDRELLKSGDDMYAIIATYCNRIFIDSSCCVWVS